LTPARQVTLSVDAYKKVKLGLSDIAGPLAVTVADLRLYEADQKTPDASAIARLQGALLSDAETYLSVGLSRPFAKPGGQLRHWLQINNIHVF
jgi:hypothetical protein